LAKSSVGLAWSYTVSPYLPVAICGSNGPIQTQAGPLLAYMFWWQLLLPCWLLAAAAMGEEAARADLDVLPHLGHVELCKASVDEETYEWHVEHLITKEHIPIGRGAVTIHAQCMRRCSTSVVDQPT